MLNQLIPQKLPCISSKKPLILAPLRGITGSIFRSVFFKHFDGFNKALSPFISTVKGATFNKAHIRDVAPENNSNHVLIPQIIGNNADEFLTMAVALAECGYTEMNWNLGCPAPMVAGKQRGSGLLKNPDRIKEILDAVIPKLPLKLSIKTRLGFTDTHELIKILPLLCDYPLTELCIHARSAVQMYKGVVDLAAFEECAHACTLPLVYNGDIGTDAFFNQLTKRFPSLAGIMIGRGAIANPFLAEQICGAKEDSSTIKAQRIQAFVQDIYAEYKASGRGGSALLGVMKELWHYLAPSFQNGDKLLKTIRHSGSTGGYEGLIGEFFFKTPLFTK